MVLSWYSGRRRGSGRWGISLHCSDIPPQGDPKGALPNYTEVTQIALVNRGSYIEHGDYLPYHRFLHQNVPLIREPAAVTHNDCFGCEHFLLGDGGGSICWGQGTYAAWQTGAIGSDASAAHRAIKANVGQFTAKILLIWIPAHPEWKWLSTWLNWIIGALLEIISSGHCDHGCCKQMLMSQQSPGS